MSNTLDACSIRFYDLWVIFVRTERRDDMRRTPGRIARRLTAAAAAVLLSTTALTIVTDSPALAAQGCTVPSHSVNGGGGATMYSTTTVWTGPYSVCNVVGHVDTQQVLWMWCWVHNAYGNTWWYVRVGGTSTYGWVYENYADETFKLFGTNDSSGDPEPFLPC
jgi:hypothetical protein